MSQFEQRVTELRNELEKLETQVIEVQNQLDRIGNAPGLESLLDRIEAFNGFKDLARDARSFKKIIESIDPSKINDTVDNLDRLSTVMASVANSSDVGSITQSLQAQAESIGNLVEAQKSISNMSTSFRESINTVRDLLKTHEDSFNTMSDNMGKMYAGVGAIRQEIGDLSGSAASLDSVARSLSKFRPDSYRQANDEIAQLSYSIRDLNGLSLSQITSEINQLDQAINSLNGKRIELNIPNLDNDLGKLREAFDYISGMEQYDMRKAANRARAQQKRDQLAAENDDLSALRSSGKVSPSGAAGQRVRDTLNNKWLDRGMRFYGDTDLPGNELATRGSQVMKAGRFIDNRTGLISSSADRLSVRPSGDGGGEGSGGGRAVGGSVPARTKSIFQKVLGSLGFDNSGLSVEIANLSSSIDRLARKIGSMDDDFREVGDDLRTSSSTALATTDGKSEEEPTREPNRVANKRVEDVGTTGEATAETLRKAENAAMQTIEDNLNTLLNNMFKGAMPKSVLDTVKANVMETVRAEGAAALDEVLPAAIKDVAGERGLKLVQHVLGTDRPSNLLTKQGHEEAASNAAGVLSSVATEQGKKFLDRQVNQALGETTEGTTGERAAERAQRSIDGVIQRMRSEVIPVMVSHSQQPNILPDRSSLPDSQEQIDSLRAHIDPGLARGMVSATKAIAIARINEKEAQGPPESGFSTDPHFARGVVKVVAAVANAKIDESEVMAAEKRVAEEKVASEDRDKPAEGFLSSTASKLFDALSSKMSVLGQTVDDLISSIDRLIRKLREVPEAKERDPVSDDKGTKRQDEEDGKESASRASVNPKLAFGALMVAAAIASASINEKNVKDKPPDPEELPPGFRGYGGTRPIREQSVAGTRPIREKIPEAVPAPQQQQNDLLDDLIAQSDSEKSKEIGLRQIYGNRLGSKFRDSNYKDDSDEELSALRSAQVTGFQQFRDSGYIDTGALVRELGAQNSPLAGLQGFLKDSMTRVMVGTLPKRIDEYQVPEEIKNPVAAAQNAVTRVKDRLAERDDDESVIDVAKKDGREYLTKLAAQKAERILESRDEARASDSTMKYTALDVLLKRLATEEGGLTGPEKQELAAQYDKLIEEAGGLEKFAHEEYMRQSATKSETTNEGASLGTERTPEKYASQMHMLQEAARKSPTGIILGTSSLGLPVGASLLNKDGSSGDDHAWAMRRTVDDETGEERFEVRDINHAGGSALGTDQTSVQNMQGLAMAGRLAMVPFVPEDSSKADDFWDELGNRIDEGPTYSFAKSDRFAEAVGGKVGETCASFLSTTAERVGIREMDLGPGLHQNKDINAVLPIDVLNQAQRMSAANMGESLPSTKEESDTPRQTLADRAKEFSRQTYRQIHDTAVPPEKQEEILAKKRKKAQEELDRRRAEGVKESAKDVKLYNLATGRESLTLEKRLAKAEEFERRIAEAGGDVRQFVDPSYTAVQTPTRVESTTNITPDKSVEEYASKKHMLEEMARQSPTGIIIGTTTATRGGGASSLDHKGESAEDHVYAIRRMIDEETGEEKFEIRDVNPSGSYVGSESTTKTMGEIATAGRVTAVPFDPGDEQKAEEFWSRMGELAGEGTYSFIRNQKVASVLGGQVGETCATAILTAADDAGITEMAEASTNTLKDKAAHLQPVANLVTPSDVVDRAESLTKASMNAREQATTATSSGTTAPVESKVEEPRRGIRGLLDKVKEVAIGGMTSLSDQLKIVPSIVINALDPRGMLTAANRLADEIRKAIQEVENALNSGVDRVTQKVADQAAEVIGNAVNTKLRDVNTVMNNNMPAGVGGAYQNLPVIPLMPSGYGETEQLSPLLSAVNENTVKTAEEAAKEVKLSQQTNMHLSHMSDSDGDPISALRTGNQGFDSLMEKAASFNYVSSNTQALLDALSTTYVGTRTIRGGKEGAFAQDEKPTISQRLGSMVDVGAASLKGMRAVGNIDRALGLGITPELFKEFTKGTRAAMITDLIRAVSQHKYDIEGVADHQKLGEGVEKILKRRSGTAKSIREELEVLLGRHGYYDADRYGRSDAQRKVKDPSKSDKTDNTFETGPKVDARGTTRSTRSPEERKQAALDAAKAQQVDQTTAPAPDPDVQKKEDLSRLQQQAREEFRKEFAQELQSVKGIGPSIAQRLTEQLMSGKSLEDTLSSLGAPVQATLRKSFSEIQDIVNKRAGSIPPADDSSPSALRGEVMIGEGEVPPASKQPVTPAQLGYLTAILPSRIKDAVTGRETEPPKAITPEDGGYGLGMTQSQLSAITEKLGNAYRGSDRTDQDRAETQSAQLALQGLFKGTALEEMADTQFQMVSEEGFEKVLQEYRDAKVTAVGVKSLREGSNMDEAKRAMEAEYDKVNLLLAENKSAIAMNVPLGGASVPMINRDRLGYSNFEQSEVVLHEVAHDLDSRVRRQTGRGINAGFNQELQQRSDSLDMKAVVQEIAKHNEGFARMIADNKDYMFSERESLAFMVQAMTGSESTQQSMKALYGEDLYNRMDKEIRQIAPDLFNDEERLKQFRHRVDSGESDVFLPQSHTAPTPTRAYHSPTVTPEKSTRDALLDSVATVFTRLDETINHLTEATDAFGTVNEMAGQGLILAARNFGPGGKVGYGLEAAAKELQNVASSLKDYADNRDEASLLRLKGTINSAGLASAGKMFSDSPTNMSDPPAPSTFMKRQLFAQIPKAIEHAPYEMIGSALAPRELGNQFENEMRDMLRAQTGENMVGMQISEMHDIQEGLDKISVSATDARGKVYQLNGELNKWGEFELDEPEKNVSRFKMMMREIPGQLMEGLFEPLQEFGQLVLEQIGLLIRMQGAMSAVANMGSRMSEGMGDTEKIRSDYSRGVLEISGETNQLFEEVAPAASKNYRRLAGITDSTKRNDLALRLTKMQGSLANLTGLEMMDFDDPMSEVYHNIVGTISKNQPDLTPAERTETAVNELERVMSMMVESETQTGVPIDEMLLGFSKIAPTATKVGLDPEDIVAMIATRVVESGESPEDAAATLEKFINSYDQLLSDTEKVRDLTDLGFNPLEAPGDIMDMEDFFDLVTEEIENADTEEAKNALMDRFATIFNDKPEDVQGFKDYFSSFKSIMEQDSSGLSSQLAGVDQSLMFDTNDTSGVALLNTINDLKSGFLQFMDTLLFSSGILEPVYGMIDNLSSSFGRMSDKMMSMRDTKFLGGMFGEGVTELDALSEALGYFAKYFVFVISRSINVFDPLAAAINKGNIAFRAFVKSFIDLNMASNTTGTKMQQMGRLATSAMDNLPQLSKDFEVSGKKAMDSVSASTHELIASVQQLVSELQEAKAGLMQVRDAANAADYSIDEMTPMRSSNQPPPKNTDKRRDGETEEDVDKRFNRGLQEEVTRKEREAEREKRAKDQKYRDTLWTNHQRGLDSRLYREKYGAAQDVDELIKMQSMGSRESQRRDMSTTELRPKGGNFRDSYYGSRIERLASGWMNTESRPGVSSFLSKGMQRTGSAMGDMALPVAFDIMMAEGQEDVTNAIGAGIAGSFIGIATGNPMLGMIGYEIAKGFMEHIDFSGLLGTSDQEQNALANALAQAKAEELNPEIETERQASLAEREQKKIDDKRLLNQNFALYPAQEAIQKYDMGNVNVGDIQEYLTYEQRSGQEFDTWHDAYKTYGDQYGKGPSDGFLSGASAIQNLRAEIPEEDLQKFLGLISTEGLEDQELVDVIHGLGALAGTGEIEELVDKILTDFETEQTAQEAGDTPDGMSGVKTASEELELAMRDFAETISEIEESMQYRMQERTADYSVGRGMVEYGPGGSALRELEEKFAPELDKVYSGQYDGTEEGEKKKEDILGRYERSKESIRGMSDSLSTVIPLADELDQNIGGIEEVLYSMGAEGQAAFMEQVMAIKAAQDQIFEFEQLQIALKETKLQLQDAEKANDIEAIKLAEEKLEQLQKEIALRKDGVNASQEYLDSQVTGEGSLMEMAQQQAKRSKRRRWVPGTPGTEGTPAQFRAPSMMDVEDYSNDQLREAIDMARRKQEELVAIMPEMAEEFRKAQFMMEGGGGFAQVTGVEQSYVQDALRDIEQREEFVRPDTVDVSDLSSEEYQKVVTRARELQGEAVSMAPGLAEEYDDSNLLMMRENNKLLMEHGLSQEWLRVALEENTSATEDNSDQLRGHYNVPGGYQMPTVWDYYNEGGKETGEVNYPGAPKADGSMVPIEMAEAMAAEMAASKLSGGTGDGELDLGAMGSLTDPSAAKFGYPDPGTPGTPGTAGYWEDMESLENINTDSLNVSGSDLLGEQGERASDALEMVSGLLESALGESVPTSADTSSTSLDEQAKSAVAATVANATLAEDSNLLSAALEATSTAVESSLGGTLTTAVELASTGLTTFAETSSVAYEQTTQAIINFTSALDHAINKLQTFDPAEAFKNIQVINIEAQNVTVKGNNAKPDNTPIGNTRGNNQNRVGNRTDPGGAGNVI